MNPEQQEIFRVAILRVLDANRTRFGLGMPAIRLHLARFGFTAGDFGSDEKFENAIADELQYLSDKGLIEETLKIVSQENRAWRITAKGIAFVDRQG